MPDSGTTVRLTPEEAFLWDCARTWRSPTAPSGIHDLDWSRIVEASRWNRMQTLLRGVLSSTGLLPDLPEEALEMLQEDVGRYTENAERLGGELRRYLRLATERGLETVVLKGLSVSVNIYNDPVIRPGGDVDLLVRKEDVDACVAVLEAMGLGRWWPHLMDDTYYGRHHLHQQRCSKDIQTWFEAHWTLDHPYTLLTIDYDAMMDRTTAGELLGEPVRDLSPSDLLLSLAVHLVKHAVYLPNAMERRDLARLILADGMLMYFLDVAEVISCYDTGIDWSFTVDLAQSSGATTILGCVLGVCHQYLGAPVPRWVLDALPVRAPGGLTSRAMERLMNYEIATFQGQDRSRFWDIMLMTDESFILRPIRALDTIAYFFPGVDYLQRRYGANSWTTRLEHLGRATGQFARLGFDTAYYSLKRSRRRRVLEQSVPEADLPQGNS